MPFQRTQNIRFIKAALISLFLIIIIIFSISRIINYIKGPYVIINEPKNGLNTSSSTIIISGQSLRINKITINDSPITVDEKGFWQDIIIVFPGINNISIKAEDKFGRKIEKKLDIIGKI